MNHTFGRPASAAGAALTDKAWPQEGFRWPSARVWVHTCAPDHPAALGNCQARGMSIFKIESHETASSPANP